MKRSFASVTKWTRNRPIYTFTALCLLCVLSPDETWCADLDFPGSTFFLHVVNTCQRSIAAYGIGANGLLRPTSATPRASIAYHAAALGATGKLYATNTGYNNAVVAYEAGAGGNLRELNRVDHAGEFGAAIAINPRGRALYRPTQWETRFVGLLYDQCHSQAVLEGINALWSIRLGTDGSLGTARSYPLDPPLTAVSIDVDGAFLFGATELGFVRSIHVFRLDENGEVVLPPAHSEPNFFLPELTRAMRIGTQQYLIAVGDGAISVFNVTPTGALSQVISEATYGLQPRGLAVSGVTGESAVLYVAQQGHTLGGGNSVDVFRIRAGGELTHLQTLELPPGEGTPLFRRPSGVAATSTHLYVTNYGYSVSREQEGSVLVYAMNADGTLRAEPLQEVSTHGIGASSPMISRVTTFSEP